MRAHLTVTTVGQPTLESWKDVAADQTAALALRRQLLGDSVKPALVFFGGYGDGYNASVRLLGSAVAPGGPLSGYDCLLTPHPGQGGLGQVERSIFAQMKLPPNRVHIVTSNVASSPQVAAFSNLTASDDSTCGVQSLFIGVPSTYIDPRPAGSYVDVAVATGLIRTFCHAVACSLLPVVLVCGYSDRLLVITEVARTSADIERCSFSAFCSQIPLDL